MVNFGNSKIGRRIVVLVFVSVILSVVTLTGAFLVLQLHGTIEARKAGIQATGYVFASAIADHVAARDQQEALKVLRSIGRIPDIAYVVAIDANGHRIAALGKTAMLQDDTAGGDLNMVQLLRRGTLPVSIDIVRAAEPIGRLVMVADVSGLRLQLAKAMLATVLAALAAGALGVAAAVRLQRRITGPIVSLTTAMSHIREARDYSTKVTHEADDETGALVETFNAMITEIGNRDRALERMAYMDGLTGLANRQEFQRQLDALLASGLSGDTHAALFLLDLDEFKSINDSYGHSAGDKLLIDVAANLKRECPDNLQIARLGGDEFAIIGSGIATEEAAQAALAGMFASLSKPIEIMSRQVLIGASAGVAMIPRDGNSSGELLRRADLALYSAKREGRGRVHFYRPKLDEDVQVRTAIALDLQHAISGSQLEAYYQPQVNIRTGAVEGVESLLRWNHPVRGQVPPGLFIPIAESNGLICDLGHWILRESCRQAKAWIDDGFPLKQISVNVSVAQIRQFDFHREVEDILVETGLPASALCLELTESLFAGGSLKRVKHVLETLKGIGVMLAIDDFGTGYSSMSYLQGFPFDKLKIDRAFVEGIEHDADKRRLLKGMIELGHALDLSIVAEGAETVGEVAHLRKMQADQVQGYVFSRPVPAVNVVDVSAVIVSGFDERFGLPGRPQAPADLLKTG